MTRILITMSIYRVSSRELKVIPSRTKDQPRQVNTRKPFPTWLKNAHVEALTDHPVKQSTQGHPEQSQARMEEDRTDMRWHNVRTAQPDLVQETKPYDTHGLQIERKRSRGSRRVEKAKRIVIEDNRFWVVERHIVRIKQNATNRGNIRVPTERTWG